MKHGENKSSVSSKLKIIIPIAAVITAAVIAGVIFLLPKNKNLRKLFPLFYNRRRYFRRRKLPLSPFFCRQNILL